MGGRTVTTLPLAYLFDGFISFFPYWLDRRIFRLSTYRFLSCCILLCLFTINSIVTLSITPVPQEIAMNRLIFFFTTLAHNVSLFVCFISVVSSRRMLNSPFFHFEFAIAYLRNCGVISKLQCPLYFSIVPYVVPMMLVLPEALVLELDTFRIISLLNYYLMVYFFYQTLFKILGILKVLKDVLIFCKNSLIGLGDGIQYLGKTDKIESLLYSFNHLCSSCILLNEVFSVNFLTTVSMAFLGGTASAYIIIVVSQRSLPVGFIALMVIAKCLELSMYVFLAWYLVAACTSCSEKVKEFNELLYQLTTDDITNEILGNRKVGLHLVMKREITFTACSFFAIDYSLIHSMTAGAATYLVMLIQFNNAAPALNPSNSSEFIQHNSAASQLLMNATIN